LKGLTKGVTRIRSSAQVRLPDMGTTEDRTA
jgi:hypothetical protein